MWKAGFANQPTSVAVDDGLALTGAWVAAVVRCAPPANKPTPEERDQCVGYLEREIALLPQVRVVVALGQFAYDAACRLFAVRPRPRFGHGVEVALPEEGSQHGRSLVCSYHPSQQNTFTGTLTEPMFDAVFARARTLAA
jgi:uracil-DNA glycosylase family 4